MVERGYTVTEVAKLAGVTVKALHYYHKIGLLKPAQVTEAGYRLYGSQQLERLQQILFYRELDFSLEQVAKALADEPGRVEVLSEQYKLLLARRQRMDRLLHTLEESIRAAKTGEEIMEKSAMFEGLDKSQWEAALAEQNEYLKDRYGYDMLAEGEINAASMNAAAQQAVRFTNQMIEALRSGLKADDARVQQALHEHIAYLQHDNAKMDAQAFAAQTRFLTNDDFHHAMLENQQMGLAYYLYVAADSMLRQRCTPRRRKRSSNRLA
jgi:DNA-binding transcriptional MerR regulator